MSNPSSDYLLGVNREELERLQFQHGVWGGLTNAFFDRIGVGTGWNCLDVGAGPGFVAMDLRTRVGDQGGVTLLEPSQLYLDWFKKETEGRGWTNVRCECGTAESNALATSQFDLIFVRWVIAFVAQPKEFLRSLSALLKPGGVIAIQDYYYEGLSLFPRGGAFDRAADAVRAYYASGGGDPYVTGKLPVWFRELGLTTIDFTPHARAGGPASPLMEWAHRFFSLHIQRMVDKGLMPQNEGDAMTADWFAHRANPDALFFSPMVVDVAGRKGGGRV